MIREALIEVTAKGMWDKHCQMYPKDTFLRGEWKADEDMGFLYTRFSRYAEAALLAIEASGAVVVPSKTVEIALSLIEEIELDEDVSAVSYYARTLKLMLSASPYAPPGG
jgi:hypothetical protein